jgi:hypothetical protein
MGVVFFKKNVWVENFMVCLVVDIKKPFPFLEERGKFV